jgi:hypothetical protein
MRWHVHGTDALTGQDVVLAFNYQDATQAVQAALRKRILVSHVTRANSRRLLFPLTAALSVVLVPLVIALYFQNISFQGRLARTTEEQSRLAETVAQAGNIVAEYRRSSPAQVLSMQEASDKVRALSDELTTARRRLTLTEQQLTTSHNQIEALERDTVNLPGMKSQLTATSNALAAAQSRITQLAGELVLRQRRIDELTALAALPAAPDPAVARVRELSRANQELAGEIDLLKSQLLIAAARSTSPGASDPDGELSAATGPASFPPTTPSGAPMRWALRTNYDAARDLLFLQFDKETFATTPTPDGAAITTGSRPANAATLRIVHDKNKDRIYSALLTLALAPDTPREKLGENLKLASLFLKTFAPSLRDPEGLLANASAQFATRDPGDRQLLLGDDYRLTLWNTKAGTLALRVESPRQDMEE